MHRVHDLCISVWLKAAHAACRRIAASRMAAVMHAWHCKAAHAAAVRRRAHRLQAAVRSRRVALAMRLWRGHAEDMAHARRLAQQAALDCSSTLVRQPCSSADPTC